MSAAAWTATHWEIEDFASGLHAVVRVDGADVAWVLDYKGARGFVSRGTPRTVPLAKAEAEAAFGAELARLRGTR